VVMTMDRQVHALTDAVRYQEMPKMESDYPSVVCGYLLKIVYDGEEMSRQRTNTAFIGRAVFMHHNIFNERNVFKVIVDQKMHFLQVQNTSSQLKIVTKEHPEGKLVPIGDVNPLRVGDSVDYIYRENKITISPTTLAR
jgi:hypothetical protein